MGSLFHWNDEYSVDGGTIDQQHRRLLELVNSVLMLNRSEEERDTLIAVVKELYRYMERHFSEEEAIMKQFGYKGFDLHVIQHRSLAHEMTALLKTSTDLDHLLVGLKPMMVNWIIEHVLSEDKKLRPLFEKQRPPAAGMMGESPAGTPPVTPTASV